MLKSLGSFTKDANTIPEAHEKGYTVDSWQDELGRLRMWEANTGAYQSGQLSLDFRSRDASHIRQQITLLLEDLLEMIQDAKNVLEEGEADADDEFCDQSMDDKELTMELQQVQESLATTISCLFQMSMLICKLAPRDLSQGSKGAEVAHYERGDIEYISEKYPRADERLVSTLERAVARRRKDLG
ncbi:MAG: hypothetical protein Q9164_003440 [Protoblastenia rupestris]